MRPASSTLMRRRALLAAGPAFMANTHAARAQHGGRPLTILVTSTPGAPPDVIARVLAEGLSRRLARPVVVDNRPGASGIIASEAAARAAPDGGTLMLATIAVAMNVSLFRSVSFDPATSFAAVGLLTETDYVLAVNPGAAGTNIAEFLARIRARPGALNYASPGIGTPHHLAMELFKRQAGWTSPTCPTGARRAPCPTSWRAASPR